jgi:phenylacetate-CoA ligase
VIFEPDLELLPREDLATVQLERLRALVARVKERVPMYGERLADVGPDDLASLDDLRRLPFTRKDDLRDTYPLGMLAVPRESWRASTRRPVRRGSRRSSRTRPATSTCSRG